MSNTIAFIGAGNMGGALAAAVCRGTTPESVTVFDPAPEKTAALRATSGCTVATSGADAISRSRYVVLAVKPQIFRTVLDKLLPALQTNAANGTPNVLVSIVAGISLAEIEQQLAEAGLTLPVIRVIPNTPVAVGEGLLLLSSSAQVNRTDFDDLCALLRPAGRLEEVPESILTKAMSVFSCSPAFVYLFIEAMADGAVQLGLPRDMAQRYAAQAVRGAAAMVLETGMHPGALKDAVCSPGGYTIQGVAELEKRGFRAAAAQAVLIAGGAKPN
jgi:pyrroline-5-carboxylate reductase